MPKRDSVAAPPIAPEKLQQVEAVLGQALRGKSEVVRLAVVCLLAKGHLLIEDVPGVGKTTLAHALARVSDCAFQRVQFTGDMLPSDVVGVTVYNAHSEAFEFKPGPVFTQFLLADEINRAAPKTQSALLEAMNEQQVTVDGRSYPLREPFMVLATQNPAEHHGTYPLPESQLDRFLMKIRIGYPDLESEREILRRTEQAQERAMRAVITEREVLQMQSETQQVRVDEAVIDYMLAIVDRTRNHEALALGVSPRGAQALYRASQAFALTEGRSYVVPDDVKRLVLPVFAHRLVLSQRGTLGMRADSTERILHDILTAVDVPL